MRLRLRAAVRPVFWLVVLALLLPAALITATRLVEPHFGLAIQVQAFTPFALPLYAAVVLLLLGYVGIRRVRHASLRTVAWPVALLALAGLVLHGVWFAPLLTGATPEAAEDAERITVMTVNLLNGDADAETVVQQVRESGVDVLVANEITPRSLAALEDAGLDMALPHRDGDTGPEGAPDGTMVFTRKAMQPVTDLDTEMGSILLTVGDLAVLAVHPTPPVFPDRWRDDHAVVRAAALEHRPDLIMGDFNATNDHGPLRELRDAGYRDAIELTNAGFRPTWPDDGGVGLIGAVGFLGPVVQIDHVLVADSYTVLGTATRDLPGSDHRLVLATVARS